jgi:hypothetical protein
MNEGYIVVYMSCFKTHEQTNYLSEQLSRYVIAHLNKHTIAYPLYRIHVRLK